MNSNVIVSLQLRLIIPDNTSIKETLKIFVNTIAQQEDEINGLKSAMSVMALESAAAHESIKAWTVELLKEAQRSLIENINESKTQIQNFVYNVQGFADNSSTRILLTSDSMEAINTLAPQPGGTVIKGKLHSANERNARHSSNFYDDIASPLKISLQLDSYPGILKENSPYICNQYSSADDDGGEKKIISKTRMLPSERKAFYDSVGKNGMPAKPQLRWKWAIRKIMGSIRRSKLQVALTRFRLLKGASIEERLARVECAVLREASGAHHTVSERAEKLTQKAEEDTVELLTNLKKLQDELEAHKEKSHSLHVYNVKKIEEIKADCVRFDRTCADLDRSVVKLGLLQKRNSKKASKPSESLLSDSTERRSRIDIKEQITPLVDHRVPTKLSLKENSFTHNVHGDVGGVDEDGDSCGVEDAVTGSSEHSKAVSPPEGPIDSAHTKGAQAHDNLNDMPGGYKESLTGLEEDADISPYMQLVERVDNDSLDRMDGELDSLNRRLNSLERGQAQVLHINLLDLQNQAQSLHHNASGYLDRILLFKAAPHSFDISSNTDPDLKVVTLKSTQENSLRDLRRGVAVNRHRVMMLLDVQRVLVGEISSSGAPRSASKESSPGSGFSSPRVFSSEAEKQGASLQCDEILELIRESSESLASCEAYLDGCSTVIGQPVPVPRPSSVSGAHLLEEIKVPLLTRNMPHSSILASPSSSAIPSDSPSRSDAPLLGTHTPSSVRTKKVKDTPALSSCTTVSQTANEDIKSRMTAEHVRLISCEVVSAAMTSSLDPIRHRLSLLEKDASTMKESVSRAYDAAMQALHADKHSKQSALDGTNRSQPELSRGSPRLELIKQPGTSCINCRDSGLNEGVGAQRIASGHEIDLINSEFRVPLQNVSHSLSGKAALSHSVRSPRSSSESQFDSSQRIDEGKAANVIAGAYERNAGVELNVRHAAEGFPSLAVLSKPFNVKLDIRSPRGNPGCDRRGDGDESALLKYNPEITKLRDEIQQMEIALKTLARDKINGYQAQQMIEKKTAQTNLTDDKVDSEAFAVVEVAVKHLASELDDLRHAHSDRLASVKKQFEDTFEVMTLNQTTAALVDPRMYSSVITTGQCLGCGRLSAFNGAPIVASGQEIFRGGFRMPHSRMPGAPLGTVPLWPTGGSEKDLSLTRPKTTVEMSKSIDMGGIQNFNEDSTVLFIDSTIPQNKNIRPRTSSKSTQLSLSSLPLFSKLLRPMKAAIV